MSISRILSVRSLCYALDSYLSGTKIALGLKRHFPLRLTAPRDTALHSRKYFAVSAGLNRIVSVLNSRVTPDRRYLLRLFPVRNCLTGD
jgi:hypothetical protein